MTDNLIHRLRNARVFAALYGEPEPICEEAAAEQLEAKTALIALLRASLRKVEDEVERLKSDAGIKAALIAWFDPHHPDQGDFAARMRKAIDAALAATEDKQHG